MLSLPLAAISACARWSEKVLSAVTTRPLAPLLGTEGTRADKVTLLTVVVVFASLV
jgi:hypothetical protein